MNLLLSSQTTYFFKRIFPVIWLTGFGTATLVLLVNGDEMAPFFAVMTVALTVTFWLISFRLKRVEATEGGLLVSNFREEELIPYANIVGVGELKWINARPVVVTLRKPCRFGHKIIFMPYWQLGLMWWTDHPAAVLLRERMGG